MYGNSQFADADGNVLSSGLTRLMLLDDDPNTPLLRGPVALDIAAGSGASVSGLSVDYFNSAASLKVRVISSQGQVSWTNGSYANSIEFTGTLQQINQKLTELNVSVPVGQTGAQLLVDVAPTGRSGVVGALTVPVVVHNPASITAASSQSVVAATSTALSSIAVSDIDSNVLRVTLTSAGGSLQLGSTSGLFTSQSGSSTVLEGLRSDVNAALGQLAFTALPGRSTASLQVTVDDKDPLTSDASQRIELSVTAAPPSLVLPSQYSARMGASTLLSGFAVRDADSSSLSLTLSASAGTLAIAGALPSGVVVTSQSAASLTVSGSPALLQQLLGQISYTAPLVNPSPPP